MRQCVAVVIVLGLLPSAELHAQQTAHTTLRVSTRVEAACEITASDLDLGAGAAYLRATCSPNTGYRIGLSRRTPPGVPTTGSQIVAGKDVQPGAEVVTGIGTGATQDHTVFGAVPATQIVPADAYGDAITLRVFY